MAVTRVQQVVSRHHRSAALTPRRPGDRTVGGDRPDWPNAVWARIGIGLGLGVGLLILALGVGLLVPYVSTGDDDTWTPQERAVAEHARVRTESMLSSNVFQPAVTVTLDVEVLAAPETVEPDPAGAGVCGSEAPDRAAVAHVEARTLFGITLWTYEVTCRGATLLGGI